MTARPHPASTTALGDEAPPRAAGPLRRLARAVLGDRPPAVASTADIPTKFEDLSAVARMAGGIYWEQDPAGRYVRIDRAAGAAVAALLGRTRWEAGTPGGQPGGDGPRWEAHRRALERREPFSDLAWEVPGPVGMLRLLESGEPRYSPTGTFVGYSGVLRESPRMPAQEGPAAAGRDAGLAMLRNALRLSPMPTMLAVGDDTGAGWRIAWSNAAGCALLGRGEPAMTASEPSSMFAGNARACSAAIALAVSGATTLRRPATVLDVQSGQHAVIVRVDPLPPSADGEPQALLALDPFQAELDATRSRLDALREELDRVQSGHRELESAARELELFSSAVSHDLRAPIRVIDGFASILREDFAGVLGRFGVDHVERILAATARMNRMIDALLRLAKVSSEPLAMEAVDLSEVARSVIEDLRAQDPDRQVEIEVADGLEARGDRTLLRIVLENLLGNAWKYTGRQPAAKIVFAASEEDGRTVFSVQDNGAGFDMRFADRLFRVFQRLHGAAEFPGTGVGLATVSRIIRRHRGRIWAQGRPDAGARFSFTIDEPPAPA